MWLCVLVVTAQALRVSLTPQSLSSSSWELREQASITADSILLNAHTFNTRGQLISKEPMQVSDFNLTLTLTSACSSTQATQGLILLLSQDPLQPGDFFGVRNVFTGVGIAINQRTNEIEVFLNDGKRDTREESGAAKCVYSNPLEMHSLFLVRKDGQLWVQVSPEQRDCGRVDFFLSRFYIGLSSVSVAQSCVSVLHSLIIETPDPISTLQMIAQSQQEMDIELKDVLGELKELNSEFGCELHRGQKPKSLSGMLKTTEDRLTSLQKTMKQLKDAFSVQLKRNEWLVSALTRELEEKRKMIEFELIDLTKRVDKGELADKIGRWVEIYSRRTLTTEPELTQTLRDIREQSEKVESYVKKDNKFVWIYILLGGLLCAALLIYRQMRQVTKLHAY